MQQEDFLKQREDDDMDLSDTEGTGEIKLCKKPRREDIGKGWRVDMDLSDTEGTGKIKLCKKPSREDIGKG